MTRSTRRQRFIGIPGLKATSCLTVVLLIFLETVLLSTVSNCAKTFFMHWNTSNSIFRIDNTDHIIDVNKGNLAFEYDQVHIICPVYEPGTFDNETEKYIIYNVSKVEYETCRITNANPRIIAICDKPQKLMYFTITFRPFTPQPGGLEFLPGNDYYFISTSSKDDLHRRIGGRCSTNNMKVVFKVCCAPETDSQNVTQSTLDGVSKNLSPTRQPSSDRSGTIINSNTTNGNNDGRVPPITINTNRKSTMTWYSRDNDGNGGYRHSIPITSTISVQQYHPHPTSSRPFINSGINKFNNKNPSSSSINNNNNNKNFNNNNFNHSNTPSQKPTKKTNEYEKHPNEVVKNEELTYNNHGNTMRPYRSKHSTWSSLVWMPQDFVMLLCIMILIISNYSDHFHTIFESYWTTFYRSLNDNVKFLISNGSRQRSNNDRHETTSNFNRNSTSSELAIVNKVSALTKMALIASKMPSSSSPSVVANDSMHPIYILKKSENFEKKTSNKHTENINDNNAFHAIINNNDQIKADTTTTTTTKINFNDNYLDDDEFDNNKLIKLNICHSSKYKYLVYKHINCINSKIQNHQTTTTFDTDLIHSHINNTKSVIS